MIYIAETQDVELENLEEVLQQTQIERKDI